MSSGWVTVSYDQWGETCDTLHGHSQLLGKLAVALAPPEPQLQHAALRLTARGWETNPLRAPDGSGSFVVALDLRTHETLIETSRGDTRRVSLLSNRSVGAVTQEVLAQLADLVGPIDVNLKPQEVPWEMTLDNDEEHAHYAPSEVANYFAAATQVALILAEFRAPYRGRSTPVNAWWGSFDLAVNMFSGREADPPSQDFIMRNAMDAQEVAFGWWPGDRNYTEAAFYAYAHPAPAGFAGATLSPGQSRWDAGLGEYILDWKDVCQSSDPRATALEFAHSAFHHACAVCDWDPALLASAEGSPPPIT